MEKGGMPMAGYDLAPLTGRLMELSDRDYARFNQSLTPTAQGAIMGVRVPLLRGIAREIVREADWRDFLDATRESPVFEMKMLHAMALGYARCGAGERLRLIDAFLPHIGDWAVCDTLVSTFKPRGGDLDPVFQFARECAQTDIEFRKRFGLVLLMSRFHDAPYLEGTLAVYRAFRHEGYYARMGAAWGLATLWLYAREACLSILEENLWDPFTHNRAIQKLCESYRISDEDKALARSLRRKREA